MGDNHSGSGTNPFVFGTDDFTVEVIVLLTTDDGKDLAASALQSGGTAGYIARNRPTNPRGRDGSCAEQKSLGKPDCSVAT